MTVLFLLGLAGYEIHMRHSDDTFSIASADETIAMEPRTSTEFDAAETETEESNGAEPDEKVSNPTAPDATADVGHRIDLNTADAEQLKTLPGIGDVLAERIVTYREEHGGFSSIEEIMNVKGIASGKFADIQDEIYVSTD